MRELDLIKECILELYKKRDSLPDMNVVEDGYWLGLTYAIGVLKGALVKGEINK